MTVASIKNFSPNFSCEPLFRSLCSLLNLFRPPRISYCATQAQFCLWQSAMNLSPGQRHALLDSDQTGSRKESGLPDETEGCQFMQWLICVLGYKAKSQHMLSFIPPSLYLVPTMLPGRKKSACVE